MVQKNDFQFDKEHSNFRFGISQEDFISMKECLCDKCNRIFMVGKMDVEPIGEMKAISWIYKRVVTVRCPCCGELIEYEE